MLQRVAKKEGHTLPAEAAALIATLARGSFRDALGILQKVLGASSESTVSLANVAVVTGAPTTTVVMAFVRALAEKDTNRALLAISEAMEAGVDLEVFADLVLTMIRSVLLVRYASDMKAIVLSEYGEDEQLFLIEMSGVAGQAIHSKVLVHLIEATEHMNVLQVPALALELAVVKIAEER
jgi:DNA polymerase III gamma/tau subunit